MPSRRNFVPSVSRLQKFARGGENLRRQLRRRVERMGARADPEIGRLEFQRHGRAGELLGLQPRGNALGLLPQQSLQRAEMRKCPCRTSSPTRRFWFRDRARRCAGRCRARAATGAGLRRRSGASARSRRRAAGRRWCDSRRAQALRRVALPTPQMNVTGCGARKARASARPSTAKPRGLSRSEAILARNLLEESPIDTVMPISVFDAAGKSRQRILPASCACRRSVPDRSRNASSIDSGSTSGVSASIMRAHLAADRDIFLHVGPHDARRRDTAGAPRTSASPSCTPKVRAT